MENFSRWETPGVERLLDSLVDFLRDKSSDAQQREFLLRPLSRFVDSTGQGLDLLWDQVCRDVDDSTPHRAWQGLHC